ncbi:MAG: class I SAM-dependent methyltransferase [Lachnospiraceae bacterium]|nr:class I SAM-dependent methyltransferase [Lachnospiraceae bacterium]
MDNKHCRFCGKELVHTFVDLGLSPISNEYVEKKDLDKGQYYYPLNVKVCHSCFLVQALVYQKPEHIFTNYKYFSSFSKSWLEHCKHYVDMIVKRLQLDKNSMVYELACNDGYLLQYFKPYQIPVCGVEPAENVAQEAKRKGIEVEVQFWAEDTAREIVQNRGKADLIIGNNVLAHVPDINSFVEGIRVALKDEGTVTLEFPHLLKLIKYNQFDTVYHEHFSYFSLGTVIKIFQDHALKIYDVEELPTHGGSLRVYAALETNRKYETADTIRRILKEEQEMGLLEVANYENFSKKVLKIKIDSLRLLCELKEKGAKIAAFGAAAKGNTFLNYCGIGREFIDFAADSSVAKQGLYLPGTRIPITSLDKIREIKPNYIVFLAWNLKEELAQTLEYTREWNCKFITFIPEVTIF